MASAILSPWEHSIDAGEAVIERCLRATAALDTADIAYMVIGGNAVAEWVARIDDGATRYTKDVDLLIERSSLDSTRKILEREGFIYIDTGAYPALIDGPNGKVSAGIHLHFAGEPAKAGSECVFPSLADSERGATFRVASLEALIRMKLSAWRNVDGMHLCDLLHVGLFDATWPARFAPPLGARLQEILDDPNG